MKVEIIEEELRHEIPGEGLCIFVKGDVKTVPDKDGEYFCRNGWAIDLDGKCESAERDTNRKVLYVDSTKSETISQEAK